MATNMLKWPKLILFGNSLTQFSFSAETSWGALLANTLQRKCDVVNRGFSGYNTRWNHLILPRLLDADMAADTAGFVVFLGANDSNSLDLNPQQHVPLAEYKENLKKIVDYVHSVGVAREKVVLVSPPPCDTDAWGEFCKKEYGKVNAKCNKVTKEYAVACQEAAQESNAKFIDLYHKMMKNDNWREYLSDGLHLSPSGSQFLYSELECEVIEKLTAHLPIILPDWKDVDHTNPQDSLLTSD